MCFEFILHNSHLKLEWEAGYLLAVHQNSKVFDLSRVLSTGSFCLPGSKNDYVYISPAKGSDENKAPMPVSRCPDIASFFLCKVEAALPAPSAFIQLLGHLKICTCRPGIKKKRKKEKNSSFNLEKLTMYSLHSEPCGGLIKNINSLR